MPPVPTAFHPRSLSTDNIINIVFGIFASLLGIFTVIIAWRMRTVPTSGNYRGPRDDSKLSRLSAGTWLTAQGLPYDIELQPIAGTHRDRGLGDLGLAVIDDP